MPIPYPFTENIITPIIQADLTELDSLTTPSWLDITGTLGNRMQYDSTGALTWAPANMLTNSGFIGAVAGTPGTAPTNWATATAGGSIVSVTSSSYGGNAIRIATTSARHIYQQTLTMIAYTKYIYTVKATINTAAAVYQYLTFSSQPAGTTFTWYIDGVAASAGTDIISTGSHTITLIATTAATAGATLFRFGGGCTSSATCDAVFEAPQLEAVTYQSSPRTYLFSPTSTAFYPPRYDYNPTTLTAIGALIEDAGTNLLTYSQTFATAWADTNITRVSTTRTSPDGTGNALEVSASAANGTIIRTAAIGSSAERTLSVWLKRVSGTGDIQYTLDNGTNWTTQAITSSWARYTFAATTADQRVGFRIVTSGDTIQIWGSQLETGPFSSSYVPTGSGTVTRVADIIKLSGVALTIAGATAASAIIQTTQWENSTAAARDLLASSTSRRLLYSNSSNTVISTTDGSTSLGATIGGSATFTGSVVRSAISWNGTGRSIVANNGTLATDSVVLGSAATVTLGGYSSTITLYGWVSSLAFYNQRLSDTILGQKSTVGALY